MKTIANLKNKLVKARWVTRGSYGLLLITLIASSIAKEQPAAILAVTVVPLLIFLPGFINEHYKTLSMLSFVTLMYFVFAVPYIYAPTRTWFDIVEVTLIVTLFIASMLFSRWKQYSLYQ